MYSEPWQSHHPVEDLIVSLIENVFRCQSSIIGEAV